MQMPRPCRSKHTRDHTIVRVISVRSRYAHSQDSQHIFERKGAEFVPREGRKSMPLAANGMIHVQHSGHISTLVAHQGMGKGFGVPRQSIYERQQNNSVI